MKKKFEEQKKKLEKYQNHESKTQRLSSANDRLNLELEGYKKKVVKNQDDR